MTMSSSTYVAGFSLQIVGRLIYTGSENWAYFDNKANTIFFIKLTQDEDLWLARYQNF